MNQLVCFHINIDACMGIFFIGYSNVDILTYCMSLLCDNVLRFVMIYMNKHIITDKDSLLWRCCIDNLSQELHMLLYDILI